MVEAVSDDGAVMCYTPLDHRVIGPEFASLVCDKEVEDGPPIRDCEGLLRTFLKQNQLLFHGLFNCP